MMNQMDLDFMRGMVSILNEATDKSIITDEQYNDRLNDLKELEKETKTTLINSPTCTMDIKSIIEIKDIKDNRLKECFNIDDIIEFANQKEMIVYVDYVGTNMLITYDANGIISNIQVDNTCIDIVELIKNINIPAQINIDKTCTIKGKISFSNKPQFLVNDVVGIGNNIGNNLNKAKELGFDIVPHWFNNANNGLNPKNLQSNIDYVYDYTQEKDLSCSGVVFKFNNIENDDYYGIIYKRTT